MEFANGQQQQLLQQIQQQLQLHRYAGLKHAQILYLPQVPHVPLQFQESNAFLME